MNQEGKIWIGLAEVVPLPGRKVFEKGRGAFANAMARAHGVEDFRRRVVDALRTRDLVLIDLGEIRSLSAESVQFGGANEHIVCMLSELESEPEGVIFGAFHTWQDDDLSQ